MAIWMWIIGILMPPIVAFFKKSTWANEVKILLSMGICAVAAVVGLAVQGEIKDVSDVVEKSAQVWTAAQISYAFYFEGTKLNTTLNNKGVH